LAVGKLSTSTSGSQLTSLNATTAIDRLVASSLSSSTSTLPVIISESLAVLSYGEAERPKGGSRDPGWEGSGGARIRPSEDTGNGRSESWKMTQRVEGGAEGKAVFMVIEKAARLVHAPSPIGRPLNPGGADLRTEIIFM
jgi:hypothetical protein